MKLLVYAHFFKPFPGQHFFFVRFFKLLCKLAANAFGLGVDDTDASGWKRSGLRLYVGHKTGVQYVSNGSSLVVRVDAAGSPMTCGRPREKSPQ